MTTGLDICLASSGPLFLTKNHHLLRVVRLKLVVETHQSNHESRNSLHWLLGFLCLLCSLLADVGAGLHHLHMYAGIVHNDMKPENILLKLEAGGRLRAMVGDLGVASCERYDLLCLVDII